MRQNTRIGLILLGLLALGLLVTLLFPQHQTLGSSFGRQPGDYGAWYAYMEEQGHPIDRLSQPYDQLSTDQPLTVIQVQFPFAPALSKSDRDWIAQGNTLVILSPIASATRAPYQTTLDTPAGEVQIETTRRRRGTRGVTPLLEDDHGLIAWEDREGEGRILWAVTPFLAANAYQDQPGNFALLEAWATELGGPIWVDEYIHGYRDPEQVEGVARTWTEYLITSSLLPVGIQILVILGIGIWAANRRLGQALAPPEAALSNSETYIQALAAVLQKAHSTPFVLETLGKAERIEIQRALGLGRESITPPHLLQIWTERTGRPATELESVLNTLPQPGSQAHRSMTDKQLLQWLQQIRQVRSALSRTGNDPQHSNLSN